MCKDDCLNMVIALQDNTVGLSRFAGPGGFNDPDMLEACQAHHPEAFVSVTASMQNCSAS